MSESTPTPTVDTPKAKSTPRNVPFSKVKIDYLRKRNIKAGTEEAFNAFKSMRQFVRSNRVKLVKAGWKELAKHEHGAPYGDVPVKVARMIVNRKVDASK